MKTTIVPIIGDPIDNLYQIGLKEKEAFLKIEARVLKLISTNVFLRYGQDIVTRAKILIKRKDDSFFDQCITAYSEGLGIDSKRYLSFLALFELAAHYGQLYPELKGMIPGCTSVFTKDNNDFTHARLFDFPLIGIFEESPRLYYWKLKDRPEILSYSCEGLAPLFFQCIHDSGMSFAIHHMPGKSYNNDGQSIFQIAFESLFEAQSLGDFRRVIKRKSSITKWSFLVLDKSGQVQITDIDGTTQNNESYHLNDSSPLIFTNIPIQNDSDEFESFIKFSQDRQTWFKQKFSESRSVHILDSLTDIDDQNIKNWIHPTSTLSTIAAYSVNLTKGIIDLKEGSSAIVRSDTIVRFSLASQNEKSVLKEKGKTKASEESWKRASKAQSAFDQGRYDEAYHELQIARDTTPNLIWKEIFSFYLYVWDFKFVGNDKELSLIYKKVKALKLPPKLTDHWILMIMRMEKKLGLSPTVKAEDISPSFRTLFQQEKLASKAVFATWMNLIYPRLEILDIFSPQRK